MTNSNRRTLVAAASPGPLDDVLKEVVLTDVEGRLILAAPDMLAALRDALWAIDNMSAILHGRGLQSTLTDPRHAMRDAIAKATGEQP